MENNLQNKAKFFAQYWWQKVFVAKGDDDTYNNWRPEEFHKVYMLLKPLSDISDEDAIELMQILDCNPDQRLGKRIVLGLFENTEENKYLDGYLFYWDVPVIVDFLRSKGYLLPFNGLSTEELISRGWAVLTSNHTVNK